MIAADSPVFALAATVNAVPDDLGRAPLPPPIWPLTAANHFRFGYDGEAFAARRAGGARYWTEYGRARRPHEGFRTELARALGAVAADGPIAIADNGGSLGRAATALARRLGLDAVAVRIEFDEHPPAAAPAGPETLPVEPVRATFADFERFALDAARRVGCPDAWTMLAAFAADRIERPLVADHGELRLQNNGFDERLGRVVAPPHVTLVDNEAFTGFDRWLIAARRRGVGQLLRWSPELVAAQLDSDSNRQWLAALDAGAPLGRGAWSNRRARLALWRQAFPGVDLAGDAASASRDERFVARMRALSRRMRRAAPGCGTQHHTPLDRLAVRLSVALDARAASAAVLYGRVRPVPPRRRAMERVA